MGQLDLWGKTSPIKAFKNLRARNVKSLNENDELFCRKMAYGTDHLSAYISAYMTIHNIKAYQKLSDPKILKRYIELRLNKPVLSTYEKNLSKKYKEFDSCPVDLYFQLTEKPIRISENPCNVIYSLSMLYSFYLLLGKDSFCSKILIKFETIESRYQKNLKINPKLWNDMDRKMCLKLKEINIRRLKKQ